MIKELIIQWFEHESNVKIMSGIMKAFQQDGRVSRRWIFLSPVYSTLKRDILTGSFTILAHFCIVC